MPPFLVCIHDATPAFAGETRAMLADLAPLVGRRLALAVVPDWHGRWPLAAHRQYCRQLQDASGELLLHGYAHRRRRGWGAIAPLAGRCDEMSGLDPRATRDIVARGQRVFTDVFGEPARGFLAPGWQRGRVRPGTGGVEGIDHVLGFFSLESSSGRKVPLATWTWDVSRWGWPGHMGHALGGVLHRLHGRVPVLAIHPRDLSRGYWPRILRLTRELLDRGYEPTTPAALLASRGC